MNTITKNIFFCLSFFLFSSEIFSKIASVKKVRRGLRVETLYGTMIVREPVLKELIESPAFERLKDIRQYGVLYNSIDDGQYNRWEHSLGVLFITRLYNGSIEEQIAALLHDVSHTVFSHVGDIFFNTQYHKENANSSFQDTIHEWYLEKSGLIEILKKYGYENACKESIKDSYKRFETKLPNLCSDRIEYNLAGGYLEGLITKKELQEILSHLHFENETWFFDNIKQARMFGLLSIHLCRRVWGTSIAKMTDSFAAKLLERACELELITLEDIHFSSDSIIWNQLKKSNDTAIKYYISLIENVRESYKTCSPSHQKSFKIDGAKFSGTDPFVYMSKNNIVPLSSVDIRYKDEYEQIKYFCQSGWHIII